MKKLALLLALICTPAWAQDAVPETPAVPAPRAQTFRIDLADLGLHEEALAHSDRNILHVPFRARADHMLSAAALDLSFDAASAATSFESIEVVLNGELVQSIPSSTLRENAGQRHLVFEPTLLATDNHLELRMQPLKGASPMAAAVCKVTPGAWSALRSGTLLLSSLPLPLPNDLSQLPLPFFDDSFEHPQQVSFVLPKALNESQLKAAASVAGWFALQGRRRLTFASYVAELPAGDAVVILDGPAALQSLGLREPEGLTTSGLALIDNPQAPGRKLLIVYGADAELLQRAAVGLLRDGYDLKGAAVSYPAPIELPPLAAFEVPRWAAGTELSLGALADAHPLKTSGGHAQTLRVPFRLSPDLFVWPRDYVTLDLAYEQGISKARGPARLHVVLNDKALGSLPSQRRGRVQLRVPRSSLRGYNELQLQVSYDPPAKAAALCGPEDDDSSAWVAFKPDSKLNLGDAHHYALLPDLQLFIYDGFPFTAQGDLRDTSVLLPEQPSPAELSSTLSLFAHFAAITGYAATQVEVRLGAVDPASLTGRDVLTIAENERHPLLERYSAELPLAAASSLLQAQTPARSNLFKRLITGQLDQSELERARHTLEDGAVGAVFALPAPWDAQRSWVVVTASDSASMPAAPALQGFAKGERTHNDLFLLQGDQRYLFELGTQDGRGQVNDLLALRFWLSHAWVALAMLLLLAAVVWGVYARAQLAELARRRLDEASS
jgi:hypothetical protein